jgi:hypothetical protein
VKEEEMSDIVPEELRYKYEQEEQDEVSEELQYKFDPEEAEGTSSPYGTFFEVKVIGNTRLNVREAQSIDSPVVRVLLPHEKVLAYCDEYTDPEWFKVVTDNEYENGYVLRKFVVKVSEE